MPERRLVDFADPARCGDWETVDDVVMGGISRSELRPTADGTAVFRGTVSLENDGGFASVRSRAEDFALTGSDGLALRVRGDGRAYKLQLRTDAAFDRIVYQARFAPRSGTWETVRLPFTGFAPTFRGRVVDGAPPLDAGAVRRIGLLISDQQAGPFALELAWIAAFEATDATPPGGARPES
jgi:monofunctional biosynthetic peptidoglycan transglycosylase